MNSQRADNGQSKILVVGTQPAITVSLRTMLTLRQLDVLVADDPKVAIQLVERGDNSIRLALIDVCAIRVDPRVLAESLRAANPGLRTLFFSSLVDGEVIRLGIIDDQSVVRKEGVIAAIEEALGLAGSKTMTAGSGSYLD